MLACCPSATPAPPTPCLTRACFQHSRNLPLPLSMIEVPERELRSKAWAPSQRPTRASLLEELRRVPGGADPGLVECVARGAAFHHAGAPGRPCKLCWGLGASRG